MILEMFRNIYLDIIKDVWVDQWVEAAKKMVHYKFETYASATFWCENWQPKIHINTYQPSWGAYKNITITPKLRPLTDHSRIKVHPEFVWPLHNVITDGPYQLVWNSGSFHGVTMQVIVYRNYYFFFGKKSIDRSFLYFVCRYLRLAVPSEGAPLDAEFDILVDSLRVRVTSHITWVWKITCCLKIVICLTWMIWGITS